MKTKPIQLEVKKYYKEGNIYFRVDYIDFMEEPIGVEICFFTNHVNITNDTNLFFYEEFGTPQEITKEEFEAKLEEAKIEFTKLYSEIKTVNQ